MIFVSMHCSEIHWSEVTSVWWCLKSPPINCLLNGLFRLTTKGTPNLDISGPFGRGMPTWLVDSPHKGPLMWIVFPCHDIIMSLYWSACQSARQQLKWNPKNLILQIKGHLSETTAYCHCNKAYFLTKTCCSSPHVREDGMSFISSNSWFIYIMPQLLQWYMQYDVILDPIITAPNSCLAPHPLVHHVYVCVWLHLVYQMRGP